MPDPIPDTRETLDPALIERCIEAAMRTLPCAPDTAERVTRAVLSEAAAQSPAPKLCGCADAERTYEQLLDYTAELGGELDRQRALIAAVLEAVERRAGEFIGIRYEPVMTCSEIRALLEGEER